MSRHISVGIDIGSHNTRIVVMESEKKGHGLRIVETACTKSRGLRHGYIVNQDEARTSIGEAIAAAEKATKMRIRRALVSVGGLSLESTVGFGSQLISRIDGEVGITDIQQAIRASEENADLVNKKVIHRFPLFFKLNNKEVLGSPEGMRGNKLETKVLFITAFDQHLNSLINAVESAGIEVEDVVPAPFAASLVTLTKAQRTAGCVLANIGAETVSIVIFEDDKPISLQVFPIGSTDITNDIALGLRISLEEAEGLKVGSHTDKDYPQKKLDEIIEARLKDIFDLVEAHLKKINRNGLLPAGIILTGGGAGLETLEDLARASLKLPARVTLPAAGKLGDLKLDASWSVACGLCILGFDDSYTSNLFPEKTFKDPLNTFLAWTKQFLP